MLYSGHCAEFLYNLYYRANEAMKIFPELPPIRRCHNYEIKTKFTYKCTSCGYRYIDYKN